MSEITTTNEQIADLSKRLISLRAQIADIVRDKIKDPSEWFQMGHLVTQIEETAFEKGRVFERWENSDGS